MTGSLGPRTSSLAVAPVPQQPQGGFRKPVFVGASPTRGSILRSWSASDWVRAKDTLHSLRAKEGFLQPGSALWMAGQFHQGRDVACVVFVLPGLGSSGKVTVQVELKDSFV
jgi:hypothetical protein